MDRTRTVCDVGLDEEDKGKSARAGVVFFVIRIGSDLPFGSPTRSSHAIKPITTTQQYVWKNLVCLSNLSLMHILRRLHHGPARTKLVSLRTRHRDALLCPSDRKRPKSSWWSCSRAVRRHTSPACIGPLSRLVYRSGERR